ncbi:MAG TPA: DUF4132 domain-containing protein [Chloroflexota bacterium]|nr:DUF4132 domain-containing protein [Chloroflexota bacterium]
MSAARAMCTIAEVLSLFRKAKVGAEDVVMLIEAVAGWNRPQVEKSLTKRKQAAVKAYGLLPLERGEDEALDRYLFLQAFARESKKLGSERQANETAAVQAALANLAQVAGFPDAVRLEWAMEGRLSTTVAAPDRTWMVDDYRIELRLDVDRPELAFWRGDRPLKSPSEAVRRSEVYAEAKEAVAQLRAQIARFRHALENMLAVGDALSHDDLEMLLRLPVLGAMLPRLVLRGDDGIFGLFDPKDHVLIPLKGGPRSLAHPARIAHPYDLLLAGQTSAWQREIVRRRIVQPFKQLFREVYLLTPAEAETVNYSNRFAGHVVDGRVASRLLQARGWQIETGDIALPYKLFRKCGLASFFVFPDAGHYLGELDTVTSDLVYFQPIDARDRWQGWRDETRVPLADVPPIVFSEVMRDADLVVSVAQRGEDGLLSEEAYQQRAAVVTSLLEDLRLPGVTVEGHFAHVEGKLARYRVHLGSAVVHIEPGNYLCVVPAKRGNNPERFFLPFADDGDSKITEVISKILLLVSDDRIKDDSILRQIRVARSPQDG